MKTPHDRLFTFSLSNHTVQVFSNSKCHSAVQEPSFTRYVPSAPVFVPPTENLPGLPNEHQFRLKKKKTSRVLRRFKAFGKGALRWQTWSQKHTKNQFTLLDNTKRLDSDGFHESAIQIKPFQKGFSSKRQLKVNLGHSTISAHCSAVFPFISPSQRIFVLQVFQFQMFQHILLGSRRFTLRD